MCGSNSNYWRLVRLESTGRPRVEEVAIVQVFFQDHFGTQSEVSNVLIQQTLLQLLRDSLISSADRQPAEWCLRCFISHKIEQACVRLEGKFGTQHGFTRYDLFLFVLDDDFRADRRSSNELNPTQYRPLAIEILQTFDASQGQLSTWTERQVRHHRDLQAFLREHGVLLATDWGLLNDTKPELLRLILTEFYVLTPAEVTFAYYLLQAYYAIYRHDRLQQQQLGHLRSKAACSAPSPDQLERIALYLQAQGVSRPTAPERIMTQLQTIASQIRKYRLHRSNHTLPTESRDQPDVQPIADEIPADGQEINLEEEEFVCFYREQILSCLDQAIAQVTSDRENYWQRKDSEKAEQFLIALKMLYCQGLSMGEIGFQLGGQAQCSISRLLKLKDFLSNVQSRLLKLLFNSVRGEAEAYSDPERLHSLNQRIETILAEDVDTIIEESRIEMAHARRQPPTSLFANRLCHYLDSRSINP